MPLRGKCYSRKHVAVVEKTDLYKPLFMRLSEESGTFRGNGRTPPNMTNVFRLI